MSSDDKLIEDSISPEHERNSRIAPLQPTPPSSRDRSHLRSASWSFTTQAQLTHGTVLDPISNNPALQLASVIREFVPGMSSTDNSNRSIAIPLRPSNEADTTINIDNNIRASLGETLSSGEGPMNDTTKDWLFLFTAFSIILLLRFLWYHWLGFILFLGLHLVLSHSNKTLKGQVSLRERNDTNKLALLTVFLLFNIILINYTFLDHELHSLFYFRLPEIPSDVWTTLWVTVVIDYTVKYVVILIKAIVCLFGRKPRLSNRNKGTFYMLVEHGSQLYRLLLPTRVWLRYFFQPAHVGMLCAVVTSILYVGYKCAALLWKVRQIKLALFDHLLGWNYVSAPPNLTYGKGPCPICQEDFTEPVQLLCTHVFCDGCVSIWFDRERTCPLCRTPVASDPLWRDGSTSLIPTHF